MTRGESGLLDIIKEEPVKYRAYARMIANHAGPRILVPVSFPYGIGHELESLCKVMIDPGSVETARAIKSGDEINKIRNVQAATDIAMGRAVSLIKASSPKKGDLYYEGRPLTSELVRSLIHKTLMDYGCHATDTIVTCGKDTALPHALGSGTLMESEPIVIDTFPTDDMSGYFTDMTRTIVKGEPAGELLEMYDAVRDAQDLGMSLVQHGASGSVIHQAVVDLFAEKGYGSNTSGFTHNLGHGVGLEVHEQPTLGPAGGALATGNVVTVEPGLYYRDIGGVRLENTGAVTTGGFDSFTQFPREFILR
jgi:Xaa-Pro aminopeptidase